MLVGIAVNNGIYLVDGTNQLRRTMPLGEALGGGGHHPSAPHPDDYPDPPLSPWCR